MLNYIWLGLIAIAIVVALGRDTSELANDRFRNGQPIPMHVTDLKPAGPGHFTAKVLIIRSDFSRHFGPDEAVAMKQDTVAMNAELLMQASSANRATITLTLPDGTPSILNDIAAANGDAAKLVGSAKFDTASGGNIGFLAPSTQFRIMSKVANDGILKVAETAVTLALGLIGIMALWLGVMKIAEAAGLVAMLARLVRPIMVRIFPDVPADHPAMGAMVMNMTANFLGLSNAATPLGLKAMEELNKLNPNAGTATNAMCMFLTINTTALTLIPATVIAIRLTLGSTDPSEIIAPTFLATLVSLILGVAFTRFIQRFFPITKNPNEPSVASSTNVA